MDVIHFKKILAHFPQNYFEKQFQTHFKSQPQWRKNELENAWIVKIVNFVMYYFTTIKK